MPRVIRELSDCGYTVQTEAMAEAFHEHALTRRYQLEPGPATLTATTSSVEGASIQFVLDGNKFGMAGGARETDPVLWMRLVGIGVLFSEGYNVLPSVSDPNVTIGGPSGVPTQRRLTDRS